MAPDVYLSFSEFSLGDGAVRQLEGLGYSRGFASDRRDAGHLRELAELPNVTVQIMPLSGGAHAALGMSFVLLDFGSPHWEIGSH